MATTNNVQEDEPRPTALERQVQILTAVVERLTKQNQVLEATTPEDRTRYSGRRPERYQC